MSTTQRVISRVLPALRTKPEHPFRVVKRQFGNTEVHYRGIAKKASQVIMLFALSNLCRATLVIGLYGKGAPAHEVGNWRRARVHGICQGFTAVLPFYRRPL